MTLEQEILELAALIDQLRRGDTELRVFGASSHKYITGPKLSEAEIKQFEYKYGITLPADYRLWLQLVGDGGKRIKWARQSNVGPLYGLYSLADTAARTKPEVPFQLSLLDWSNEQPVEALLDDNSHDDGRPFGALELGTAGCAYNIYLIAKGEGYGKIASHWANQIWPSFSVWMRSWAETALLRIAQDRVTDRIALRMSKEQVIDICSEVGGQMFFTKDRVLSFMNLSTCFILDEADEVAQIRRNFISVYFAPEPEDGSTL